MKQMVVSGLNTVMEVTAISTKAEIGPSGKARNVVTEK